MNTFDGDEIYKLLNKIPKCKDLNLTSDYIEMVE